MLTACGETPAAFERRCIPAEPPPHRENWRFAALCVAFRSKYTRASSPGGGSSLTRLVSRAPHRSRRSREFHHRLLNTVVWRRGAAPWAPPPDPRTGALLAERRTVVVAARVTRADQATFGEGQAHRLPNAGGHEDVSGAGERWPSKTSPAAVLHPPHGRARSLPAGISHAAGAGCKRPPARKGRVRRALPSGAVFRQGNGGRLQPRPWPRNTPWAEHNCNGENGNLAHGYEHKYEKRGVYLVAYESGSGSGSGSGPAGVHSARESGQCPAGRRADSEVGVPVPAAP